MAFDWNIKFWEYQFQSPTWLLLLFLVPVIYVVLTSFEKKGQGNFKFSGSTSTQDFFSSQFIPRIRKGIILLYSIVALLIIVALAKPYNPDADSNSNSNFKNGIDIIITMDVSLSMLAMDFQPNRLEAAKQVAKEFIDGRKSDRIGLVAFSGEAYTACPATTDYEVLKKQIDLIGNENIEGGTAIGTGLGTAVTRLRNNSLPSKVAILLTDGSNNAGETDPLAAAELAKAKNIRVYTIGVGSNSDAPTPVMTPFGIRYENMPVEIDENTLKKIAETTGGKYFRATDESSLRSIYTEIDRLEKRNILDKKYDIETMPTPAAFLNWALIIAVGTWCLQLYFFKRSD